MVGKTGVRSEPDSEVGHVLVALDVYFHGWCGRFRVMKQVTD